MTTNSSKFGIVIPGLAPKDMTVLQSYFAVGACVAISCFLLLWRCQVTLIYTGVGIPLSEIQSMDTQKQIARLMAANPACRKLFALMALGRTLFFDASSLSAKTDPEITELVTSCVNELAKIPSPLDPPLPPGRVLPTNSLSSETIGIHITSNRGKFQTAGIFSPNAVVYGISAALLTLKTACSLIKKQVEALGLKFTYEDLCSVCSIEKPIPLPEGADPLEFFLINYIIGPSGLVFTDGISIGTPTNLLPIEEDLQVTRPIAATLPHREVTESTNPITARAYEQGNEINSSRSSKSKTKPKPKPSEKPATSDSKPEPPVTPPAAGKEKKPRGRSPGKSKGK
jgi:hypothetical protein